MKKNLPTYLLLSLLTLLSLRTFLTIHLPYYDTTEARYAHIGRTMLEKHTPIPSVLKDNGKLFQYWSKPALAIWPTSAAFYLFGYHEWAGRLPYLLTATLLLLAVFYLAKSLYTSQEAWISLFLLASTLSFLLLSGSIQLDTTLTLLITLANTSLYLCLQQPNQTKWGYAFFLSLGLTVPVKGLVGIALVSLTALLWLWKTKNWHTLAYLPWKTGIPLFLLTALPVLLFEEYHSPGFLKHLIINEHFLRYLRSDFGYRLGAGHKQPYGSIWIMLAISFLPWTPLLLYSIYQSLKQKPSNKELYLLLWGLVPPTFFTLSRSVLPTYTLPGFVPLAILTARQLTLLHQQSLQKLQLWLKIYLLTLSALLTTTLIALPLLRQLTTTHWLAISSTLLLTTALILTLQKTQSLQANIASLTLLTTLTLFLATLAWKPRLDAKKTTKFAILHCLNYIKQYHIPHFLYPFGMPWSLKFYAPQLIHRTYYGPKALKYALKQKGTWLILVKKKEFHWLSTEQQEQLFLWKEIGQWQIYSNTPYPPPTTTTHKNSSPPPKN